MSIPDTQAISHQTIIIRITSKQWGARADFGWCTTYQGNNQEHPLGSGAGSVMITSSYNDRTRADLHALQAALLFLQMQLTHIFQEQLHLQSVTEHEAPLTTLVHILKIETHSPRWRLNRNWDILNSIMHNIHIHQLNWYLAQDDNPVHQHALQTANICIMEYETKYPTTQPRQQPTLEYGLSYLRCGSIIINERYDEAITHAYNWPQFTKYCCEKFLWNTTTFQLVNWKVFQHQGKKLGINQQTHLLKFVYEWLPIGETLTQIDSSASPICLSCSTTTETHNHIFKCKNINHQQITEECIARIDQIKCKWEVPTQIGQHILPQLTAWTSDTPVTGDQATTNLDHTNALQTQTKAGWGHFLKGFIATDLQNTVNTLKRIHNKMRSSKYSGHAKRFNVCGTWRQSTGNANRNKHGTTPAEADQKKQEKLLMQAQELLQTKHLLPPQYKKMFVSYAKLNKKRTRNLKTWVSTTKQTVHYLLHVNNQADDDPKNDTQSDSSNNTDTTHPAQQGLPTLTGSEASQVAPNITA
jgi:hypothetical protein